MNNFFQTTIIFLAAAFIYLAPAVTPSFAHFGMVIPSAQVITQQNKTIQVTLAFAHPFDLVGMDLTTPKQFYTVFNGVKADLLGCLRETATIGSKGYTCQFSPKKPGVYQFVMEPQPYWEELEDLFIIHYTKTIVAAFGDDENWQELLGLPVEIRPMLRPFANYKGNTFTGQVMINGKPAADTDVEVEYFNDNARYQAPTSYHTTQVVKTDAQGFFSFTCPLAGWWGFSSLTTADYTLKNQEGIDKQVELGGVLWIYMDEYQLR